MRRRILVGDGVIDLSLVDNAGRYRGYRTTANCYLVHKDNCRYKLPLVYGNAIKDGQVNAVAFNPDGTTTSTYLSCFQNHSGDNIDAPWLTKSASGIGINKGMGLEVASVRLLWQDDTSLITDVSLSDDGNYLYFTTDSNSMNIGGNAVLTVRNSSTDIMWSWHIWLSQDANILDNTTIVSTGSHNYEVAPVNLGWVPSWAVNTYYQYGRKDPFIPPMNKNSNTNKTVYDINNNETTGIYTSTNTSVDLATAIRNPRKHYYSSGTSSWLDTPYNNLWNAQSDATGNIATATIKTIYDPCPPDFCVPTSNLFYYMGNGGTRKMTTWDSTNKGATWNAGITGDALWFPACGSRTSSSGALGSVGTNGRYHSATANSSTNVRSLVPSRSTWSYTTTLRAGGTAIRPVKEE